MHNTYYQETATGRLRTRALTPRGCQSWVHHLFLALMSMQNDISSRPHNVAYCRLCMSLADLTPQTVNSRYGTT